MFSFVFTNVGHKKVGVFSNWISYRRIFINQIANSFYEQVLNAIP